MEFRFLDGHGRADSQLSEAQTRTEEYPDSIEKSPLRGVRAKPHFVRAAASSAPGLPYGRRRINTYSNPNPSFLVRRPNRACSTRSLIIQGDGTTSTDVLSFSFRFGSRSSLQCRINTTCVFPLSDTPLCFRRHPDSADNFLLHMHICDTA